MSEWAIVALGSNLGDSRRILSEAAQRLQGFSDEPLLKSSLWQTTPVDCPPDSPMFLNAVAAFFPRRNETPETLLEKLQSLEREFGRQTKIVTNEPRPLDLDLIAFRDEIRADTKLILPHPRAHQRRFVLEPLNEILPEFVFPGMQVSAANLAAFLRTTEQLERMVPI